MKRRLPLFAFTLGGLLSILAGCDTPPGQEQNSAGDLPPEERVLQETQLRLAIFLDGSGLTFESIAFNPNDRNQVVATLSNGVKIVADVKYDDSGKVLSVTRADKLTVPVLQERYPLSGWKIAGPVPAPTDLQNRQIDMDMGHFAKKFKHDEGQLPYPTVLIVYDAVSADKSVFDVVDQPSGMLRFDRLWAGKPLDKTVAWAAADCQIETAGKYAVAVYFSGELDLYVNGVKAVEAEAATPERKVYLLPLESGDNKIVARIYHENGGEWPLAVKISDGPVEER